MPTKRYICPNCNGSGKRADIDGINWGCNRCGGSGDVSSLGHFIVDEEPLRERDGNGGGLDTSRWGNDLGG